MITLDIRQRRCGQLLAHFGDTPILADDILDVEDLPDQISECPAWRLSTPGTHGTGWRPCWACHTPSEPVGPHTPPPEPDPPPTPSQWRGWRCDRCGTCNHAANDLTGIPHSRTDRQPSGCTGRYLPDTGEAT